MDPIYPNEIIFNIIFYCDTKTTISMYTVSKAIRELASKCVSGKKCNSFDEIYLCHLYGKNYSINCTGIVNNYMSPTNNITPGKLKLYYKLMKQQPNYKQDIDFHMTNYIQAQGSNWQDIFYCLNRLGFVYHRQENYLHFMNSLVASEGKWHKSLKLISKHHVPTIFALWTLYRDDSGLKYININELNSRICDIIITDFAPALRKLERINNCVWNYLSNKSEMFPLITTLLVTEDIKKVADYGLNINCKLDYPVDKETTQRIIAFDMDVWFHTYTGHHNRSIIPTLLKYKPPRIMNIIAATDIVKYSYIPSEVIISEPTLSFVQNNVDSGIFNLSLEDAQFLVDYDLISMIDKIMLMNLHPSLVMELEEDISFSYIEYVMQIIEIVGRQM